MKVAKHILSWTTKLMLCAGIVTMFRFPLMGTAQEFVSINMPDNLCAGTVANITFGYNSGYNVTLLQRHASLSRPGTIFLPDGVPCPSINGTCRYKSPVTFTDFAPGSQISSVQDIKYVRLNIEHSYIGDIFIGIECPSHQIASLMNWSGSGGSSCDDSIPASYIGWTSGSNAMKSTYFGMAYDYTGSPTCDPSVSGNAPGVGWNYCWSNNTTSGYSYASGDGLIYRSGSTHGGRVDSSNVAAHTNFYHPNQNFSALIGCPLNGEWSIVVIDAWSGDNGYIFDWEIALNPSLLPVPCELVSRDILGSGMTKINDSSFVLTVPDSITADSTMTFTLRMTNSCGDTIDTVVSINIHPNLTGERQDTACDSYTWEGQTLARDTILYTHLQTARYHCDSLLRIDLTMLQSTSDTLQVEIVENSLPYNLLGASFNGPVSDTLLHTTNAAGCDSAVHFYLTVWRNTTTIIDSTVCAHQLPVTWNGVVFTSADTGSVVLNTYRGADSIVFMTLHVIADDTVYIYDTIVQNSLPYQLAHNTYDNAVSDDTTMLHNAAGCDSTIHLFLHVWENVHTDIDTALCTRHLPLFWGGASFTDTHSVVLNTIHGADSVVTMHIHFVPNDTTDIFDTVVENNLPHIFEDQWTFISDADTNLGVIAADDCDSILHYRLKVWRNIEQSYTRQICSSQLPYRWYGETFTETGTTVQHLFTTHGADSTVTLTVILYPDYDTTIYPEICDNQTYTLGPLTLDTPGSYQHLFSTIHGCDSMVHAQLSVWPTYHIDLFDTVCASAGLTFDGVHYSEAGSYDNPYQTIHQCDSIVTLNLTLKGLYLKARAHITPTIVTPQNLDIELEDISRAAIDRLWVIGEQQYTDIKFNYTYPDQFDSVPLMLIAYSDDGCADTLDRLLQIDRTLILAPNAFTPTLETNKQWAIVSRDITDLEVWIYNRHGNLIHHYTGTDGFWDGTHDGKLCRQEVYVFQAEYHSRVYPDRLQTIHGTILLIR